MNRLSVVIGVVGSLLSCVCVCSCRCVDVLAVTHDMRACSWKCSCVTICLCPASHPMNEKLSASNNYSSFFFFKRPSRPACLTGQNPVRESEREGADSPLEAWQQPTPSKSLQTSTSLLLLLWASLVFSSFLFFFFLAVKWGEIWQMISFTMAATYFFSFICNHRALLPFFPWLFLWPTSVRKVQTRSDEKATFTVGFIPS